MSVKIEIAQLLDQADKLNKEHKSSEVISLLDDTILEKYNSAELYAKRGGAHALLKELDKALFYCNKSIELNPDHYKAYDYRGSIWIKKKDYRKAIKDGNVIAKGSVKFLIQVADA